MYDAIIIGAGPAGISAGLYLKRANKNVLILYYGVSEIEKAHKIDNFYGFPNGISGKDLYEKGILQAKSLGIEVLNEEVLNVLMNESFRYNVITSNNNFEATTVILATGSKKLTPNIDGIEKFEGRGVSYCAICDGFFYRKKNVCVIGNELYAISEAEELMNVTPNVSILTNGKEMKEETSINVNAKKIKEILGEEKVTGVLFEDGTKIDVDGIFVAEGVAGGVNFAKKLGIYMEASKIVVNDDMETNVPGIYACGNLTGGLLQINKAAYEGAKAGLKAVSYINERKVK